MKKKTEFYENKITNIETMLTHETSVSKKDILDAIAQQSYEYRRVSSMQSQMREDMSKLLQNQSI